VSHRVEPLGGAHDLEGFGCGRDELDEWLKRHARSATRQGTRTYVLVEETAGTVVGYFALAPHLLEREQAPKSVARGAPRRIPAILLAKLALDERLHGQGLGGELLVHSLTTIVNAARAAGGRIVVVDAIDESAAGFYRAHDFQTSPADPLRLVLKLSTIACAIGLEWP
jgi:GNAT superfamily N-acetyltransferase